MSKIIEGIQLSEKKKKPKPTSPEKWSRAKAKARSKFDVYPSAYANAYAAKEYKKMGGGWRMGESEEVNEAQNVDKHELSGYVIIDGYVFKDSGKIGRSTYGRYTIKDPDYVKDPKEVGMHRNYRKPDFLSFSTLADAKKWVRTQPRKNPDEIANIHQKFREREASYNEGMAETFDKPYKGKWKHSDESHNMLVKLPNGSYLNIMFNLEYGIYDEEEWTVEFWRNNSYNITGEGDQQRIFATVLNAIQKFIKKYHPERIRFSANKNVDPDQKSMSRTNLYNKLVQRYANSWGYKVDVDDFADNIQYNLQVIESKQGVAEGHADQQRKIFKKNGQPVGEIGIDRESSPGVGQYYMKHYASGTDNSGYDSREEALDDLKYIMKQSVYGELREQGVSEGIDPYRLERLDPQTRRVLIRMGDHKDPGSWLSASEAYALTLGLQYKNRDPRGWEQEVQHYVDLYRQYSGQGVAEGLNEMDKSQPSSSRGAEGLPLGKKANPVKTDKVKSDALKVLQKQYKKPKDFSMKEQGVSKGSLNEQTTEGIVYATGPRSLGTNDVDLVFKNLRTNKIVASVVGNNDQGGIYEIRINQNGISKGPPNFVARGNPQSSSDEHVVYKLDPTSGKTGSTIRNGFDEENGTYYGMTMEFMGDDDYWSFLENMIGDIMWEDDAIEAGYVDRLNNGDLVFTKQQGVSEGSGKNVVKSIKVGNFRHDLVDTGMGWQVRIYNGDELYDTGLSKNSEQKGLAALEDAVAYTEKQTRNKRQGVAEGAPELLKQEMPLVRHIEKELEQYGYEKGTPEYNEMFKHSIAMYRKFGNIDAIKKAMKEGHEHGSAYDRGAADSWYGRPYNPQRYSNPQDQAEYEAGYSENESQASMRKDYGDDTEIDNDDEFYEDTTMRFAAEKLPRQNPYGGLKDRQFRGAIAETEAVNRNDGDGWRWYEPREEQLDELKCWPGYTRVKGVPAGAVGSCKKKTKESSIMKGLQK